MQILLNGESREVPRQIFLTELLVMFDLPQQRVAVELNRAVIRRAEWETTVIANDDRIEVIHFVGGG
ncbi:MAG TPA: sulfur carrier protein ThiS [Pyrinomonadaceae bacterium]|nr:sulfur carrier protein ThiS [Pyrinomonadaceae bacterium]